MEYRDVAVDSSAALRAGSVASQTLSAKNESSWASTVGSQAAITKGSPGGLISWGFQEDGAPLDTMWHLLGSESQLDFNTTLKSQDTVERSLRLSNSEAHCVGLHQQCGDDTGRIPPTVTPHRDPVYPVMFYMDVWGKKCLPALHSVFHQLETLHGPSLLITDIIVALSACRLSRTLPQRKLLNISRIPGLWFRPDAGHESLSHDYYGAVMRKMAWWSQQDFNANPTLGLAVLILFCYLESSMGNFQEFRIHSEGTKNLIRSYPDRVICDGAELLAAWVEVEMQNWWRRVYFSTPDFHRKLSVLSLPPQLEAVLDATNNQRAAILLILCESHCLNNAAIVSCWDDRKDKDSWTNTNRPPPATTGTGELETRLSLNEYKVLLKTQSQKLDKWYALLPAFDLPEFWQGKGDYVARSQTELDIQPLLFKSHFSAMNFAYYITARVMQCTGPLESLRGTSQAEIGDAYEEAEAWISILLRIAAGIRWKQCIQLNVYTVGFAGLLLACALRSHSLATGLWMQNWLEDRLKGNDFEEGNFPVFQILEILRLVNYERKHGRDVVSLFQTVDDGGGSGKLGSYHSQLLASLWVYGRCRTTGRMCSYYKEV